MPGQERHFLSAYNVLVVAFSNAQILFVKTINYLYHYFTSPFAIYACEFSMPMYLFSFFLLDIRTILHLPFNTGNKNHLLIS